MTHYQHIKVPAGGQKITFNADMSLNVPDQPIIPYIEGGGTGLNSAPVMLKVVFARRMDGAIQVSCSGFGQVMIGSM